MPQHFDEIHERHLRAQKILDALKAADTPELKLQAMACDALYSIAEGLSKLEEELRTVPVVAYCRPDQRAEPRKPERKE